MFICVNPIVVFIATGRIRTQVSSANEVNPCRRNGGNAGVGGPEIAARVGQQRYVPLKFRP